MEIKRLLCFIRFGNHGLVLFCVVNPAHPLPLQRSTLKASLSARLWHVFSSSLRSSQTPFLKTRSCQLQLEFWCTSICAATVLVPGTAKKEESVAFQLSSLTFYILNKNNIVMHIIYQISLFTFLKFNKCMTLKMSKSNCVKQWLGFLP